MNKFRQRRILKSLNLKDKEIDLVLSHLDGLKESPFKPSIPAKERVKRYSERVKHYREYGELQGTIFVIKKEKKLKVKEREILSRFKGEIEGVIETAIYFNASSKIIRELIDERVKKYVVRGDLSELLKTHIQSHAMRNTLYVEYAQLQAQIRQPGMKAKKAYEKAYEVLKNYEKKPDLKYRKEWIRSLYQYLKDRSEESDNFIFDKIAKLRNEEGLTSKRGKEYSISIIRSIIKN